MKAFLKKIVVLWAACELLGAVVVLTGGKALGERLLKSMQAPAGQHSGADSSR